MKSNLYTIMILVIAVGMAWSVIIKEEQIKELEAQVADNEMWLDFTEQKINELQQIADHTQTSCIDILYGQ